MDLANLAMAGLVFSQFVAKEPSAKILSAGVLGYLVLWAFATKLVPSL